MTRMSADLSALMAALRITLSPADAQALADLREAGQIMVPVVGETATRQRFRVAVQCCATAPTAANIAALQDAMNAYNRTDLLRDPLLRVAASDPPFRPGGNGVAAAMPREADNDQ